MFKLRSIHRKSPVSLYSGTSISIKQFSRHIDRIEVHLRDFVCDEYACALVILCEASPPNAVQG
jgi:hypothetical protein